MAKQAGGGNGGTFTDFEDFLARLGDKDRNNLQKHLSACEAEATPAHAALWKRLVWSLANLAPHGVRTTGQRAVQFFVADGRYRLQAFALEDPRDGTIVLYAADALEAAVRAGALRGPVRASGADVVHDAAEVPEAPAGSAALAAPPVYYAVPEEPGLPLKVEVLSAAGTASAPDYYKHMLGWNRRAVRVTVPVGAGPAHVRALEVLCQHASRQTNLGASPAVAPTTPRPAAPQAAARPAASRR